MCVAICSLQKIQRGPSHEQQSCVDLKIKFQLLLQLWEFYHGKDTGLGPAGETGLSLPGVLLTMKFLKRENHYDGQLILNSVLSGLACMYDSLEMLFCFEPVIWLLALEFLVKRDIC